MANNLYMPFHVGDYMGDTAFLTSAEQHGAYMLLLMNYWYNGKPLPVEDWKLAAIAKVSPETWAAMRDVIRAFFQERDGALYHKRVEEELERSRAKSEAARRSVGNRRTNPPRPKPPSNDDRTMIDRSSNQEQVQDQVSNKPISSSEDAAKAAAAELKAKVKEIAGTDNGFSVVEAWVSDGIDIQGRALPLMREVMAKRRAKGQGPPDSLILFDKPVRDPTRKVKPALGVVPPRVWVLEESAGGAAWRAKFPGAWKSKVEERGGERGAWFPSEFPPVSPEAAA